MPAPCAPTSSHTRLSLSRSSSFHGRKIRSAWNISNDFCTPPPALRVDPTILGVQLVAVDCTSSPTGAFRRALPSGSLANKGRSLRQTIPSPPSELTSGIEVVVDQACKLLPSRPPCPPRETVSRSMLRSRRIRHRNEQQPTVPLGHLLDGQNCLPLDQLFDLPHHSAHANLERIKTPRFIGPRLVHARCRPPLSPDRTATHTLQR
ncbi:hypothetical protein C6P46_002732 [Rhodotorula mucilaginosa]|uniref:Uncharacterized protein n=1 Tax=Rhodotorula mucilaginosa TaxID=5537 RepID=A0A9P7B870_RHOMI|nr:hypothetical protein C6P46_002732 [Rhodotorula mucilaginosa]